jgi:predicted O-methyltransferase YrrM
MILQGLLRKIKFFGLDGQIELVRKTSSGAQPIDNIDLLHIDGNHSEAATLIDVLKWVPLVKQGGFIIFDDLRWSEGGVNTTGRAVEWLNANCIRFSEAEKSADWGIWIKP